MATSCSNALSCHCMGAAYGCLTCMEYPGQLCDVARARTQRQQLYPLCTSCAPYNQGGPRVCCPPSNVFAVTSWVQQPPPPQQYAQPPPRPQAHPTPALPAAASASVVANCSSSASSGAIISSNSGSVSMASSSTQAQAQQPPMPQPQQLSAPGLTAPPAATTGNNISVSSAAIAQILTNMTSMQNEINRLNSEVAVLTAAVDRHRTILIPANDIDSEETDDS